MGVWGVSRRCDGVVEEIGGTDWGYRNRWQRFQAARMLMYKSGTVVHWKFLPLLRNFGEIIQFSWGSACLAHLYRSLCRATRVDCKEMDGPLTLLVSWAWIRLPFLAPIPGNPGVFPIANRWHNWDRQNYPYRYKTLAHYRRLLDDLQEGQVFCKIQWTNRYSHTLSDDLEHLHYPLEIYMHWYRAAYADHLQLSNLVFEENPEGPPPPPPPAQEPELAPVPPPPPPPEPPQQGVEYFAPYVPDTHPSDYYSASVPAHQQNWGGPHVAGFLSGLNLVLYTLRTWSIL
ncbi:hypothetical protein Ahy_B02g057915 [Arachis hypogaea]|uniref:Aminotransferase-like plant mobile domain-containing protein n=1 Tax=Arachis hypogaea TaxID=3818 RepID=A0A445ADA6_ARAHY|nr:hypothetical protein Ahy_B02g057915 [Arachis hypogaea]